MAERKKKFLEYQTANVQGPTLPEKVSLFLYTISLKIKIAVFQYLPALTLSDNSEGSEGGWQGLPSHDSQTDLVRRISNLQTTSPGADNSQADIPILIY